MKKLLILLCLMSLLLSGCGGGDVSGVRVEIGDSMFYTRQEIEDAMDVALDHFDRHFDGCTMTEIVYDESISWVPSIHWAQQYDDDQAIVLLSDFDVDENYEGSLNPGDTYRNWQWVLTRDEGGKWVLRTWGFA